MTYLTIIFTEFLLISCIAIPVVQVILLLSPINSRFQSLKSQNLYLKATLFLFFLPVYSLLGELSIQSSSEQSQISVGTVTPVPNILNTPEVFIQFSENTKIGTWLVNSLPILSVFWVLGVIVSIFFQSYCYSKFKKT